MHLHTRLHLVGYAVEQTARRGVQRIGFHLGRKSRLIDTPAARGWIVRRRLAGM